jgi:hypothetical protein
VTDAKDGDGYQLWCLAVVLSSVLVVALANVNLVVAVIVWTVLTLILLMLRPT